MTYPGIGAMAGAFLGFIFFGFIGCMVVGAYKDCFPDPQALFDPSAVVPKAMQHAIFKHGEFTLVVTIHKAVGMSGMSGIMPWSKPDTYVSVECGKNPMKA